MFNLFRYFLWFVVICAIAISFDQLMISVPLKTPVLKETQTFYVDFRQRLIDLVADQPLPQKSSPKKTNTAKQTPQNKQIKPSVKKVAADSIANVISQSATPKSQTPKSRYLYVDGNGDLQFVDDFEQIPQRYRDSAQAMAE